MSHRIPSETAHKDTEGPPKSDDSSVYRALRRCVRSSVETLGFWTAVVLPFLHLSLLFSGLETGVEATAFLSLVVVNGIALVVGHRHTSR